MCAHISQFSEEELELVGLFDHPLGSLFPLLSVSECDLLLHHGFDVLHHHPAQGLICHVLLA